MEDRERAGGVADGPDFRGFFEAAPGLFLIVSADAPRYTIVAASDGYLDATMSTREGEQGIVGRGIFEAFPDPPSDPEATGVHNVRASIERVIATGRADVMPVQHYDIRRPDGGWDERHWSPVHSPVVDRVSGEVTHVIQRVDDVTEAIRLSSAHETLLGEHARSERARHAAEDANADLAREREALGRTNRQLRELATHLEVEQARLADVFRQAPSFLAVLRGPEHVFHLVNDAYYQLVGHRELLGRPMFEALPEVRDQGFRELLDDVLRTGEPFVGRELPLRVARTAGAPPEERFIDFVHLPLMEADGERVGVIAHGTDVTDQVLARREIERLLVESERARAEAEAANQAKSEFLAMMSHELRTPLNAIGGYAELIDMGLHGPVTADQHTALERIQRSQRALLSLINEVLNYARLETGAVAYQLTDVRVCEAMAEAEVLIAPQLRAKGLGYAWARCGPELTVRADAEKLQQVLLNLLSNAIKFTRERAGVAGRIEVSCEAAGGLVLIRVRDSGMGIPPEKAEAVFEPFVQVDQRLTRAHEGTGLGLAISRDLTRGMDGDLTLESVPGMGSTFTITLPRGKDL